MGQGDLDRAGDAISYLAQVDARAPQRLETTPVGHVLSEEPGRPRGWPSYLKVRLDALANGAEASRREPLGHRNPDNPNDGKPIALPFDEIQGRLPFVPFRGIRP
jgi:hypothetical protein